MAFVRYLLRFGALIPLMLGIGSTDPAVAQQRVGVGSAVNPDVTGIWPGMPPRRLVLGQDIVFNERITTAAEGQTQVLFVDQSTMTIGAQSDMVIDEFVYDPAAGTGKLAASLTRGVFRFVGGKLSKQENAVTMRTPSATIGIRGGVFLVNLGSGGKLDVIFVYGKGVTVTGANVSQTITRPGFAVAVSGVGAAPSDPAPAPPGTTAALLAQLDGRAGANGGARTVPTETVVAASGIANVISNNVTASVQAANQAQPSATQPPDVNRIVQQTQSQVQLVATQPAVQQVRLQVQAASPAPPSPSPPSPAPPSPAPPSPAPPSPPPPSPPPPVGVTLAGIFKSTNGAGTALGFVGQTPPARIPFTNATLANGILTVSSSELGGAGQLMIPLVTGAASFGSSGTQSPLGPVTGMSFLSADGTFFYANLTPVNAPAQSEFVAGGMPVSASALAATGSSSIVAFTVQPDAALQSNIPFIRNNAGGNLANAYISPLFIASPTSGAAQLSAALQSSLAISGQQDKQQSVLVMAVGSILPTASQPAISGVVRGSSQLAAASTPVRIGSNLTSVADGNGNSLYGSSAISGFVLDQTQSALASEVQLSGAAANYGFTHPSTATTLPSGVGANRTSQTVLTGNFGGLMNTTAQPQPYAITGTTVLATDATNNRIAAVLASDPLTPSTTGGVSNATMLFGALNSAFIDSNIYGASESPISPATVNGNSAQSAQLYFLSSGAAPPPSLLLPTGASYCQCQYLQWGYWGGDITSANPSGGNTPRIDRGNINFWAAGPMTPLADMNLLASQGATGTYNGHLIGSVFTNGNQYVAAGGLTAIYQFATQTGSFSVNNYDGRSFMLSGKAPLKGSSYNFGINNPQGLPITGSVNGSFYGPMAAETGGNFNFRTTAGPTYLTSGIFAAKR
jgi:trimeric autotransporter adhesin